jgi:hypothetical protein
MINLNKKTSSKTSFYRLMAATLTVGGVSLLMPLIASAQVLTPAGTIIRNTATGTYEDPNTPGVPISTTSNEVTSTTAEVAGLLNASSGTLDTNGGSVTTGDGLDFSFLITNTGNEVTAVHIPTTATIVGGTLGTIGANNITPPVAKTANIFVTEINGVVLTAPVQLPANGNTNDAGFITAVQGAGIPLFNGSIPSNGTIKVVVPVTVTATTNNPVSVTLGNTGTYPNAFPSPNTDVGTGTQNQPDSGTEPPLAPGGDPISGADEVRTINFAGPLPANGVREASAKNTQTVSTQINNLALATVLKTRIAYDPTTVGLNNDTLTYRLDLRVETTPPAAGITPAPLLPTAIRLNGASGTAAQNKILVSDAIPVLTSLDLTFVPPAAPAGWTRVYSTVATTTGPLDVTTQNWQTGVLPVGVTRIGYIADGPIAAGASTVGDPNGFQFRVVTTGVPIGGGTIANIAQVFGQTTAGAVSVNNPLVYDESGDPNPNNYQGPTAPTAITTPATSPTGIANPANDGTDNNTNAGDGSAGGEDNVFTINPPGIILNGPSGQPGAIGPNGNNTDFVNKSATDVPAGAAGAPGSAYDPNAITFINTVQNPASNTAALDNVVLEPITAAQAATATGNPATDYQIAAPNGAPLIAGTTLANSTTVRIAYPVGSTPTGTGRTALYRLDSGTSRFILVSSTTAGVTDGVPTQIKIASLAIGVAQDYNVIVDLPTGSIVSTGYSVPIVSYVDSNPATAGFKTVPAEDNPFNIKIDRAYTGYLKLLKQSQILDAAGAPLAAPEGTLDTTAKNPAPGQIIRYVVTYTNISTPNSGNGANVILNANNIVITEDGAALPNNWAPFTTNVASTAVDATAGAVITYFVGATPSVTTDTAITKYVDSISTVAPGVSGSLTFQRKVK